MYIVDRSTILAMEPNAPRTVSNVEVICIASLDIISRESKEALTQSSRAESERFFSQSRHTKRWNTLCISRFVCRRVDEKDPLSATDDWVRVSLYTRLHSALTGWQATIFYRAPSTRRTKLNRGRWTSTLSIIQVVARMQTNLRGPHSASSVLSLSQSTPNTFLPFQYISAIHIYRKFKLETS